MYIHTFILWVLAEPINVGWGKKETQFHGSLGKAATQSKQQEVYIIVCVVKYLFYSCTLKNSDTSELYDIDDKSYVSWRGDGQYFICSTIDSDTGKNSSR